MPMIKAIVSQRSNQRSRPSSARLSSENVQQNDLKSLDREPQQNITVSKKDNSLESEGLTNKKYKRMLTFSEPIVDCRYIKVQRVTSIHTFYLRYMRDQFRVQSNFLLFKGNKLFFKAVFVT